MSRIVIIGNAGGGKSTLARTLAKQRGLRHVEIDRLFWQEGWQLTPDDVLRAATCRNHKGRLLGDRRAASIDP